MARDGTLEIGGKPAHGRLVLSTQSTAVLLQRGRVTGTTTGTVSALAVGPLRLRLLMFGRFADGWLRAKGYVTVWSTSPGRIVLPVRSAHRVRIAFRAASGGPAITRTVGGVTTSITIPICTTGRTTLVYRASPMSYLPDGRIVAATAGMPRFVPGGC